MKVYLAFGSNLGDRSENILLAVGMMDKALGSVHTGLSSFYENPAQGFDGPDFINAVAEYELDFGPENISENGLGILRACKNTEREMGREEHMLYDENGNRLYVSRTIDIDILLIGDYRVNLPELRVPHPLMWEREFVMVPLRELLDAE